MAMADNDKTTRTAAKAASNGTKKPAVAGEKAGQSINKAAEKTGSATHSVGDAVEGGGRSFGQATKRVGHVASQSAEAGRQKIASASSTAATAASATWKIVKNRKAVVAGIGAGAVTAVAASFAAGRFSAKRNVGPFTRFTGGRL